MPPDTEADPRFVPVKIEGEVLGGEYVLSWAGRTFPEDPAAIRNGFFASIADGVGGSEMIGLLPTTTIFLATAPTDLRKAYDGLAVLVRQSLGQDPLSGSLVRLL